MFQLPKFVRMNATVARPLKEWVDAECQRRKDQTGHNVSYGEIVGEALTYYRDKLEAPRNIAAKEEKAHPCELCKLPGVDFSDVTHRWLCAAHLERAARKVTA